MSYLFFEVEGVTFSTLEEAYAFREKNCERKTIDNKPKAVYKYVDDRKELSLEVFNG